MNNTLTAKEWLKKELDGTNLQGYGNFILMEKYANYKNRILEAKILDGRKVLSSLSFDTLESALIVNTYDKHFGIQVVREGKIE